MFNRGDVYKRQGHDDAGQAVAREAAHICVVPQTAIRANHRMNAALRRVARHRAQIAMHHRLATDEEQVADVIFHGDVNHIARLLQRHAAPRLRIELRARKSAEAAIGIADVRNRKLQITRAAVIQNLAYEFECSFFGAHDWLGKVNFRRQRIFLRCRRNFENGILAH